ncbi:MAG: hypothetical protein IT492_06180 [Gammaproteobacteria bacterium]|nr:hypothetical protein [Gammaproteobacteria bacterium]
MKARMLLLPVSLCLALSACFDNDHPPEGAGGLAAEVKAPMDKAAAVNQMVEDQDAAQRKAMDEQGR